MYHVVACYYSYVRHKLVVLYDRACHGGIEEARALRKQLVEAGGGEEQFRTDGTQIMIVRRGNNVAR